MTKRNNSKKRKGFIFATIALVSGFILMLLAYLIDKFMENNYLNSVQSEIFGVGFALLIIGIIFVMFRVKLN